MSPTVISHPPMFSKLMDAMASTTLPRDFQRQRVYSWEQEEVWPRDRQLLSLSDCEERITTIYHDQGLVAPELKDGRGCRGALFYPSEYAISLPRHMRILPVVLHEAAHGLAHYGDWVMHFRTVTVQRGPIPRFGSSDWGKPRAEWSGHGPLFVAIYIALLAQHGLGSAQSLRSSAVDCGVEVLFFA